MSDDSVYADDGTYLGEMVQVDDDTAVCVNEAGEITMAAQLQRDPQTGEPLDTVPVDPSEFEFISGAPGEDPRLAELQATADGLEQRMNEPPPPPRFDMPELPEARDQRWATGVNRELTNLERILGRSLTDAETHRVLADHKADWDAGVGVDVVKSALAAGLIDFSPGRDSMNESEAARHDSRVEFMTAHIEDQAREQAGRVYGEPPERMAEEYDTNTNTGDRGHSARVQLAMDTIDGHDTEGRTYDSSRTYEED